MFGVGFEKRETCWFQPERHGKHHQCQHGRKNQFPRTTHFYIDIVEYFCAHAHSHFLVCPLMGKQTIEARAEIGSEFKDFICGRHACHVAAVLCQILSWHDTSPAHGRERILHSGYWALARQPVCPY